MTDPRDLPGIVQLAGTALHAAQREDWPTATTAIKALADNHDGDGLMTAMQAWIDTAIDHVMPEGAAGKSVGLEFKAVETGYVDTNADHVAAPTAWAGRMLAARLADDEPTYWALLGAIPGDQTGTYVLALLKGCALTLNNPPEASRKEN